MPHSETTTSTPTPDGGGGPPLTHPYVLTWGVTDFEAPWGDDSAPGYYDAPATESTSQTGAQ